VVEFFDDDIAVSTDVSTDNTDLAAGDAPDNGESLIVEPTVESAVETAVDSDSDSDDDELLDEAALKMAQKFRQRAVDACMEALEQSEKAPDVSTCMNCTTAGTRSDYSSHVEPAMQACLTLAVQQCSAIEAFEALHASQCVATLVGVALALML
jgi:hypothetical protein